MNPHTRVLSLRKSINGFLKKVTLRGRGGFKKNIIQGVSKKREIRFSDSFVIEFSRLTLFLKFIYNFRFNKPNFRLVDLKITIL